MPVLDEGSCGNTTSIMEVGKEAGEIELPMRASLTTYSNLWSEWKRKQTLEAGKEGLSSREIRSWKSPESQSLPFSKLLLCYSLRQMEGIILQIFSQQSRMSLNIFLRKKAGYSVYQQETWFIYIYILLYA